MLAATIATAAALAAAANPAMAAEECGAPEPGVEVVCTPDRYHPAEHGNIHYAEHVPDGDFSLRLEEGLAMTYVGGDPDDDTLVSELVPWGTARHEHWSAVAVVPLDPAHAGDIAVTSAADIAVTGANGFGYLAGRIAGRGGVALDLRGGSLSTDGHNSDGLAGFHFGRGDLSASIHATSILGQGPFGRGVQLRHTGTGDIVLDAQGATIDIAGDHAQGIFTDHIGTGDSLVALRGTSVSVSGNEARGLFGYLAAEGDGAFALNDTGVKASGDLSMGVRLVHHWHGDLTLDAEGATIDVTGAQSRGIFSEHLSSGDLLSALRDTAAAASGDGSRALAFRHRGSGDLAIEAEGVRANATGAGSRGIRAQHDREGDVTAVLRDATLTARGVLAFALDANHDSDGAVRIDAERTHFRGEGPSARAISLFQGGKGDIEIDLRAASTVTAAGDAGQGIATYQAGAGDIRIRAEGGRISAAADSNASAVVAQYFSNAEGDVLVDLADVTLTADGESSTGVLIGHWGTRGDLSVRLRDTELSAAGDNSNGVLAALRFGNGAIRIDIDAGAVAAEGDGANGVSIGLVHPRTGAVIFAADAGPDGHRDQTVTANGPVRGGFGDGAGVRLAGGGRVWIGAGGSAGADSGVAIRALGDGAALHVSADFDGRRPGDVFKGDIRNDAGRTTIVVDGVTLHDPMLGATGAFIPRGARDLTLVADDTVLGRAFSAADFVEPLAPRAAVYETLPDFLFRLAAPADRRLSARSAGGYAGLEYGEGSIEAARTTTGAAYEFERSAAAMTLSGSPDPRLRGWIELHHGEGAAEVASPGGAGTVDAVFTGYRAGAAWQGSHWYASASLSSEDYVLDVATARHGLLGAGIDAQGRSLGIELGRSISTREGTSIVPRAWLVKAEVSADGFVDAVNAAVSLPDTERAMGGIGLEAQSTHELNSEGALTFGGFADIEVMSGDAETVMLVAGERLAFQAPAESLAVGLNLNYRRGRFSLDAGVLVRNALDTGSSEYAARLRLGGLF